MAGNVVHEAAARQRMAVAKLTEAISEVQQALGIEKTRKLLRLLADGLGAQTTKPK